MRYTWILLILFLSCSKERDKKLYLGELYFSPIRIGSFYNMDDTTRKRFEQGMDTVQLDKAVGAKRKTIELYRKFKANGLSFKPFVDLRINDTSYVKLYLDSADYDRIKIYKRQDLLDNHQKVLLWGRTKEIGKIDVTFLYCTELIDVQVIDGQTFPEKEGKFQINDYQ